LAGLTPVTSDPGIAPASGPVRRSPRRLPGRAATISPALRLRLNILPGSTAPPLRRGLGGAAPIVSPRPPSGRVRSRPREAGSRLVHIQVLGGERLMAGYALFGSHPSTLEACVSFPRHALPAMSDGGGSGVMDPSTMSGPMWMPDQPLTMARLFAWHPQPIPVFPMLGLLLAAAYVVGLITLGRRGDRWPVGRTIWWMLGVAAIELMTATGFDGYGMEFFSVHMVQHMVIGMLVPILLMLGAPVTLLLRALPARRPGHRSARRLVLAVVHSRVVGVIAHPVVTVLLFLFSLYALYFTPLFDWLMSTWWGHNLMLLHFLVIGCLYFWGILGVDPSPRRGSGLMGAFSRPVLRIAELAATVPFHAFFGIVFMMATTVIVRYYATPPPWATQSALSDQQTAGGIAWAFTEMPTLLVLGVIFLQWQRGDSRQAAHSARRAERFGDTQLDDYNAALAALARRDERGHT
jgi:putative membrane protein